MSVYPDDSTPIPSGALTPAGVKALQSVTEESAKKQIRSQALVPWEEARGNFFENIIGGIGKAFQEGIKGISSGLSNIFAPIRNAASEVRDGQIEMNNRADLLSPLLDYCSVSTPPGDGDAMKGTGRMPFTYQIGPYRGATPENGMIRLDDKGLWDLRAMVTASWVALGQNAQVYLRVLKPDGETVYSEQAYFISTITTATMTLVSSVVIPGPGYYVDVWVAAATVRGWWTGPQWTRLTAQHISRSTDGGTGAEQSTTGSDKDDDGNVDSGSLSGSRDNPRPIGSSRGSL